MKILQICNKPPFPPLDGGAIGMNNVTMGLIKLGHSVKVLSVNTSKHFVDFKSLPDWYIKKTNIEFVFIDTKIKPLQAFSNLFSNKSYNISRYYKFEFVNKIKEILQIQEFDIVQIESIFLNNYIPIIRKYSQAKIVLRAPNVEFIIWERIAKEEKNLLKKLYLMLLAKRLKKEEINCLNLFDALYTVTEIDKTIFNSVGLIKPSTFIPTGIDINKRITGSNENIENTSLFFIGALDWIPNREGLFWFVEQVFPQIVKEIPEIRFYIAGRNSDEKIFNLETKNIKVLGEVEDAVEFMNSKGIMIVPLFSGSGMRVKIIEGMMLSKAIITTNVGVEGIIHENQKDIIIANNVQEFVREILELLLNKEKFNLIRHNAKLSANTHYSDDILNKKLEDFLLQILN